MLTKCVFKLTLRQIEGVGRVASGLLNVDIKIPAYTQICRHQNHLPLDLSPMKRDVPHVVIDSTGLKVYGEGEWKTR